MHLKFLSSKVLKTHPETESIEKLEYISGKGENACNSVINGVFKSLLPPSHLSSANKFGWKPTGFETLIASFDNFFFKVY